VDSNRDEDVALENVQHCHSGLVWAEDCFIAKSGDWSRFTAVGGENRKHCLSKMRRGFSPRVQNVEDERLIAVDRMITPFRIVVAISAVLIMALDVFDRYAQNFLSIGLGDNLRDVDFVAGRGGAYASANDDRNGESNECPSHKIVSVEFETKDDGVAAPHQSSIMRDERIALCDQESNI